MIPPESPAARDEGPRLIPLPDGPARVPGLPPVPTDGYVSMADDAIRLWGKSVKSEKPAPRNSKTGTRP